MDYKQIESKWQKIWEETGLYKFDRSKVDKKYYCLEMFSYPSGAKLHAGHWYNYGPADYVLCCSGRALCERIFHRGFKSFYVIQRMLAVLVLCGIAVFSFHPAGIILDGRSHFPACRSIDDYGATGVATVVQANNILFACHNLSL